MEQNPQSPKSSGPNPIYWLLFAICAFFTGISGLFLLFAGGCVLTGDGNYKLGTLIFMLVLVGVPLVLTVGGIKLCQWLWNELHPR